MKIAALIVVCLMAGVLLAAAIGTMVIDWVIGDG